MGALGGDAGDMTSCPLPFVRNFDAAPMSQVCDDDDLKASRV